jgi:hypothetical protein
MKWQFIKATPKECNEEAEESVSSAKGLSKAAPGEKALGVENCGLGTTRSRSSMRSYVGATGRLLDNEKSGLSIS